jgi:hypothetical protein
MKPRMQNQVQPRETAPRSIAQIQGTNGEVQKEIQNFLRAVDSYPDRVAKEPRLSFQQHLSNIFAAFSNEDEHDRRDRSPRRH